MSACTLWQHRVLEEEPVHSDLGSPYPHDNIFEYEKGGLVRVPNEGGDVEVNLRHNNDGQTLSEWDNRVTKLLVGDVGFGTAILVHKTETEGHLKFLTIGNNMTSHYSDVLPLRSFRVILQGVEHRVIKIERAFEVEFPNAPSSSVEILTVKKPRGFEGSIVNTAVADVSDDVTLPGFNGEDYSFLKVVGEDVFDSEFRPGQLSISMGEVIGIRSGIGRHNAASFKGKSGSGIIANGKCVGIHRGFDPSEGFENNWFIAFDEDRIQTIHSLLMEDA